MGKNTAADAEAAAQEAAKAQAAKFPVERLAADCRRLFGVSACTFAGATHGMTGEHTVGEMRAHIEKWRGKEVR